MWRFNKGVFEALKAQIEIGQKTPAQVHSHASHLSQILNACENIVYWKNKIIADPDKHIRYYNEYANSENWVKGILKQYGEEDQYDTLITQEAEAHFPGTVTVKNINPEEEIYVKETTRNLESVIGNDFTISYSGNLTWDIKPKLKNITIVGEIKN